MSWLTNDVIPLLPAPCSRYLRTAHQLCQAYRCVTVPAPTCERGTDRKAQGSEACVRTCACPSAGSWPLLCAAPSSPHPQPAHAASLPEVMLHASSLLAAGTQGRPLPMTCRALI